MHNNSPADFVDKMLISSRFAYGQFISALSSFKMADDHSQYDFVIRSRWDLEPVIPDDEALDRKVNAMDKMLVNEYGSDSFILSNGIAHGHKLNTGTEMSNYLGVNFSDVNWTMTHNVAHNLARRDRFETLERAYIDNNIPLYTQRPWAHRLWHLIVAPAVDDIFYVDHLQFSVRRN